MQMTSLGKLSRGSVSLESTTVEDRLDSAAMMQASIDELVIDVRNDVWVRK